jgi:hypothetical protein
MRASLQGFVLAIVENEEKEEKEGLKEENAARSIKNK